VITGPERARKEESERQERSQRSGWDQSLVRTKLPPASTGTVFDFMIYYTTHQFLTRVNNITYLRVSWGNSWSYLLVQRRKEKRSQDQTIYTVSNNFAFV
jgi:hypothetical protein